MVVASAAPPVRFPCAYGIDMSARTEIIAARQSIESVRGIIGADALVDQDLDDLRSLYAELPCCMACFSGEYPRGLDAEDPERMEGEKEGAGRAQPDG